MSIPAADAAATQPSPGAQYLFVGFLLLVGLWIAYAADVFRRGSIRGPERLTPDAPRGGLFFVMLIGVFVWFGTQIAIGVVARVRYEATGTTQPFGIANFTAADYALLATVPGVIGLIAVLAGDVLVGRDTPRRLGLTLGQLLPGVLNGFVGFLILMPVVIFASFTMEELYKRIGFEHPSEHDLLRVLNEAADPMHRVLLIVGATLVAPVFEEILFRGHLQTLLVAWIDDIVRRVREPAPVAPGFPVVPSDPNALPGGGPPGSLAQAESGGPPPGPKPLWRLWLAIVITSLLFAIIHPGWTIPAIFLLSLGLGYAYERTGNLWVPLTIHLLFNSFQTALFLLLKSLN